MTAPRCLAPAVCSLAVALTGCGATPPQAPFAAARVLGGTTGTISSACGQAYQLHAFAGDHGPDQTALETRAQKAARRLASVYATNRRWIYQGETVATVADESVSALRECGLPRAARLLAALTAAR